MAIIVTTGTVDTIKFGDDFGFFTVNEAGGGSEVFILWFLHVSSGGPLALYTSLLMIAATRGLTIDVTHESTSAFVTQIRMHAP